MRLTSPLAVSFGRRWLDLSHEDLNNKNTKNNQLLKDLLTSKGLKVSASRLTTVEWIKHSSALQVSLEDVQQ